MVSRQAGKNMADEEQLRILKQGPKAWNDWRQQHGGPGLRADFRRADLTKINLSEADLSGADLSKAKLFQANVYGARLRAAALLLADLREANLSRADLSSADLNGADLSRADFNRANLSEADFRGAHLRKALFTRAILSGTDLGGADLNEVIFSETIVSNVDLSTCKHLENILHHGPSQIDIRTLQRSGPLPLAFLRGVGLPDALIEYLPSLLNQAIQHYSCFISYSSEDHEFVHRLHADLQDKGVRCWFAPHDMKIGAKIRDTIDDAIRVRDKLLLVLSEASIASDWVEDEVDKAFEEERQRGSVVLFPVRVDDAVMETKEAWAAKLRRSRNIGDFRAWKDHDAYQNALARVLRDLRIEGAAPNPIVSTIPAR
jgi:hypothetical protein